MRVVTKIRRQIAGKVYEAGDECDIDDAVARQEVADGRAERPAAKAAAPAAHAAPVAEAPKPATAPEAAKPAAVAPKASTEVKPVSTQQAAQPPQGEYATRDLKAKG